MTDSYVNKNNNQKNIQDEFSHPKHSVKRKQTERKIRKKRKKVNRLKSFTRFVLLLFLLAISYQLLKLPQWYLPKDTFKNTNNDVVEIINNQITPDYVIKNSLKDLEVSNLPIFLYGVNQIKREVYELPIIKKVYVRRYAFPVKIQIIVRERVPIAIIKKDLSSKPTAFYTSDGFLVMHKDYMRLGNYSSALKILTVSKNLKQDMPVDKIQEIEKVVQAVEMYSNEKVEYIDMRIPNDIYVKIKTTNIRLGTLDSTVYDRIKRIYTILPQINKVNSKIKYIDLSWDKVNYLKLEKSK